MSFISGNNMGGKEVKYYDNPNYDPKNEGKSKIDAALKRAAESAQYEEIISEDYYTYSGSVDYNDMMEAEATAHFDAKKVAQQQQSTISYFRAKERERLNKDYPNAGKKTNNPKFSQPVSYEDKVSKYNALLSPTMNERYRTGENKPLKNSPAGVDRELQAIKQRTRDASMEFRGMVFDFINEVTADFDKDFAYQSIDFDATGDISGVGRGASIKPQGYSYIENKYFPNSADKQKARNIILKMIDSTDNIPPDNTLRGVAEEIAAIKEPILRDFGIGQSRLNTWGVSSKNTLKNLEKSMSEFANWKAKKGVPRIVKLLGKLP